MFQRAAQSHGEAIGFHADRHFVPHPIQDRTDEEMRALAEAAFPAVWQLVCSAPAP